MCTVTVICQAHTLQFPGTRTVTNDARKTDPCCFAVRYLNSMIEVMKKIKRISDSKLKRTYKDDGFKHVHVERDLEVAILVYLEQHVEKVLAGLAGAGAVAVHPLQVLLDDAVEDPEHRVAALLRAPHGAAELADDAGGRPQVRRVEPRREPDGAVELPQEHVAVPAPVAHHGAHRGVGHQRRQPRAHLHGARLLLLRAGGGGAVPQHGRHLLLADGAEGQHPARAQELRDGELPELAPVLPVGREDDVPAVVGEHAHGGAQRPRRERGVVRLHHLARRLPGRDHQRGHLADAEQHHRPVATRQVTHRAVRELAREVVHAADQRQLPRPRRKTQAVAVRPAAPALREHDEQQRHQSQSEVDIDIVVVIHWRVRSGRCLLPTPATRFATSLCL